MFSAFSLMFAAFLVGAHALETPLTRTLLQEKKEEKLPDCPLLPEKHQGALTFKEISKHCGGPKEEKFCDKCACALFADFAPAIIRAQLFSEDIAESEEKANKAISKAAALINICTQDWMEVLDDTADVDSMNKLQECSYEEGSYPECLPSIIEQIMVATIQGVSGGKQAQTGHKLM